MHIVGNRYDEQQYLRDIEGRVGHPISPLGPDFSLPANIKAQGGGTVYGQQRGGESGKDVAARLEQIRQNVDELARLEWDAQTSFLTFGQRISRLNGGPARRVK